MQIDVLAYRIKGFAEKAARAGCSQVFIGMESINPRNLEAAGKKQNDVTDYTHMIEMWHAQGIACHVGYIIGFPFDTPESVREDVRRLRDEVRADQASFFMLTPLPGSRDHAEMLARGDWMDDDLNRYDSFHAASRHPNMDAEAWNASYREAWRMFYEESAVKAILGRAGESTYWGLFTNMLWYKYSISVEHTHPMICGFFRRRTRVERRPGFAVETRLTHARRRLHEYAAWTRGVVRLYFEMQEIWLATRGRRQIDANLTELRERYGRMRGSLATRLNPLAIHLPTRRALNQYWMQTLSNLKRGRWWRINPLRMGWNLMVDAKLSLRFGLALLGSGQLAKGREQSMTMR